MPRNRPITKRTIRGWSGGESSFKKPNIELHKLVSSRINKGMITSIDSADIPNEALQYAKNSKVLFDKVGRRDGLLSFGPTKPNANAIMKMSFLKQPTGVTRTYRFTPTTIHELVGAAWVPVTNTVPLVGTVNDRLNISVIFDVFAFTNNGANNIQWIDPVTATSDNLIVNLSPDLPHSKFRYCTGFYNRVVMGALRDSNEILLGWTGEYGSKAGLPRKGLEDLDPLVNETSGFSPLIDSPKDVSDFISGLFGFSSIMVILREKSIWLATKQASFINPFNSYPSVPGVGCDSPFTTRITKYGLVWFDRRTRSIYHYTPGSTPEDLGHPIEKSIICNVSDTDLLFGLYDPSEDTYSLCIPSITSNIVQVWTFYFQDKAWTYNEYNGITSFDDVELLTGYIAIDDLVGTINNLSGTIDGLSPDPRLESIRVYGFSDGTLAVPDKNSILDVAAIFNTDLISKTIVLPSADIYVAKIVIEYIARTSGEIFIQYAADGGVDPSLSFIVGDIFTITTINKPQIITFNKVIHSRRFSFAVRSDNCQFDILGYEVWVVSSGDISQIRQVS